MSSVLSEPQGAPIRRHLKPKQIETVGALAAAAVAELAEVGYVGLTVRGVARRAGVAPATAYTYFASKDHLITEAFWRRVQALPPVVVDHRKTAGHRVAAALDGFAELASVEPGLSEACTLAMVSADPDVSRLRLRIAQVFDERVAAALGDEAEPEVITTLSLVLSGGLLRAGLGYLSYPDLIRQMSTATDLLVRPKRGSR